MTNRLADEISPYLLQHAENPVDWYPWGPEVLEAAKAQEKPIFLSIGYSACHWCHVMAHESFENEAIAELLNRHFFSIKVDREERPELDHLYMDAVQMMTGRGGWPLSVFLTPTLEPIYGGTYFPPSARGQMPGFDEVIRVVASAWSDRRDEAIAQGNKVVQLLRSSEVIFRSEGDAPPLNAELFDPSGTVLARSFDQEHGGFGSEPKFPNPVGLRLLLRRWHRTGDRDLVPLVTTTLDRMAAGGIHDHLGGGFHRYSTDARWLVPHFEKMLSDNALLAGCYLEAWQATGNANYARVVRETLDYVLRDMTHAQGGFFTAEDADSEGREGKFYLWTPRQIAQCLGPERAETFARVYDVTEAGNFEGENILNRAKTPKQCAEMLGRDPAELEAELLESRRELLDARTNRVRPGRDDKILTSWNGLMIEAMAQAGAALAEARYVEAAGKAADFVLEHLREEGGRLHRCWRNGQARHDALLEDYAALANALISLYETQFDERRIDEAILLADEILGRFVDSDTGRFHLTGSDHEPLIARPADMLDSSVPSGGGLAATALVRLGMLCGRRDYVDAARASLEAATGLMRKAPIGVGQLLIALDAHLGPSPEIVVVSRSDGPELRQVLTEIHGRLIPGRVLARRIGTDCGSQQPEAFPARSESLSGIFAGKEPTATDPTVFVCREFTCQAPISGPEAAATALASLARPVE